MILSRKALMGGFWKFVGWSRSQQRKIWLKRNLWVFLWNWMGLQDPCGLIAGLRLKSDVSHQGWSQLPAREWKEEKLMWVKVMPVMSSARLHHFFVRSLLWSSGPSSPMAPSPSPYLHIYASAQVCSEGPLQIWFLEGGGRCISAAEAIWVRHTRNMGRLSAVG